MHVFERFLRLVRDRLNDEFRRSLILPWVDLLSQFKRNQRSALPSIGVIGALSRTHLGYDLNHLPRQAHMPLESLPFRLRPMSVLADIPPGRRLTKEERFVAC